MTTTTPIASDAAIRFPSSGSLRAAHSDLLKKYRSNGATAEIVAEVDSFIRLGKATGALLDNDSDRWEAQSQLDYWATQLYQPGHEPPDATLDEFDPQLAPEIDDALCPYMGLDAFREFNRSVFFGRGRLISELIDKLKTSRFLAVLGSSGSGKSSLVRAGLIPELKNGALPGSENWAYCAPIVPGSDPLANLAHLVMPGQADPGWLETTIDRLRQEPGCLTQLLSERFGGDVVLVVDQFEEVFTLCTDEMARSRFVANLIGLVQSTDANHHVILTMRSDFETNVARLPNLQAAFDQNAIRITPFSAGELREAIEAPAALIGLRFEEGIVDALLNDILGEPAALPLLQFTLLKLWENRERNRVTWATYRKLGGGRQALARSADEFYNRLIHEEQVTMRRILLKMVRPGEGLEVTSNRIPRADLYPKAEARDRIDRVLDKLIQARLVRVSEGDTISNDQVEIAHEALVRNWPRLVEWLEEERVRLRQRQRLTTAAEEWQRLNHASSALWRRELLEEALRYDDLNELERQFVKASNARQRRVRAAFVAGAAIVITLLLAAVFVFRNQSIANAQLAEQNAYIAGTAQAASTLAVQQSMLAAQQTKLALASRLASLAHLIVDTQKSKQTVGVLLAIQSMRLSPASIDEASRALQDSALPIIVRHAAYERGVNSVAFSPDGKYVVSGSDNGTVHVLEIGSGKEIAHVTHSGAVNSVAFSPNGHYVVSGSDDGTVRVWEATTGNEIARMAHDDWVLSVAFSPNGQYVVSSSVDGTARVWEVMTGNEIARMTHDDWVRTVAFSPNGQYVVSGSDDNTARVWEAMTGHEVARMTHDDWVRSVAFSPTGQYVVSGSDDYTVRVWEATTGNEVARMSHRGAVNSVAFSPDGKYVVSGSSDSTARVWEARTGNEIARVTHDDLVGSVAFSPNGQYVVSGSDDGTALISDASSGKSIVSMTHNGEVRAVAFSPDGQYAVSGVCEVLGKNNANTADFCYEGDVDVWKVTTSSGIAEAIHNDRVNSITLSPDGKYVASGSDDSTARIWETATGKEIARMTHDDWVSSVAFSPDSKYVISGSGDGTARVWEAGTGREVARMTQSDAIRSVDFSPDGRHVASGGSDGSVRLLEVVTDREIDLKPHEGGSVWFVAFSPDGQYLASGGCEEFDTSNSSDCIKGNVDIFDVNTGETVFHKNHKNWVDVVAFSRDGKYVVSGSDDGTARVWEFATGKEISQMTHNDWVYSVAFSPDGQYVVSGSDDGTARVWEMATGKEIARMTHGGAVRSVAFSSDGKYVISGGRDNTARVWEASTGKEIARMTHDDRVNSVAFSPDGKYGVSGSSDKTVRIWNWRANELITNTCSRLYRNLTSAEWKQYMGDTPYQATCPNLPIHPTVISEAILPTLLDAGENNRTQKAVEMANEILGVNSAGGNGDEQAIKIVNNTILDRIYSSDPAAGVIEPSLVLLDDAKMNQLKIDDSTVLNNLCWFGSIYGYAKDVLQYCEQAVALAPDDPGIRDSRGLARALDGDVDGAISDFQYMADNYSGNSITRDERTQWIEDLKNGINPFTPEVLELLKSE